MKIQDFKTHKQSGRKISMVTCYDHWSAQIINSSNVDVILVGDSLAMVMHGHPTTLAATVPLMALHTAAVVKGAPDKFVIADLPFMSYRKGLSENMNAMEELMRAGAQALKLEGAKGNLELIRHAVDSGVPIQGHLGLTPQSIHQLGGFKVQGRSPQEYSDLVVQAQQLEEAGCFSVVLECVPTPLAETISSKLSIPTIGIGAGLDTDGQVLVLQDMLGMNPKFKPKFLRTYLDGFEMLKNSLNEYHNDVTAQQFPTEKESYL